MTSPATWQAKQSARPDALTAALAVWRATPGAERDRMAAAIAAHNEAALMVRQCDEPGCDREGTWLAAAVQGISRRTCWQHMPPGGRP